MEQKSGIYRIVNIFDNKCYVGKSTNLKNRKNQHNSCLNRNKHPSIYLQNAYNKYGENAFRFEILEYILDMSIIFDREQYWMDYYKSYDKKYGYNSRENAEDNSGWHQTDEARNKISNKLKGRTFSGEHRKNISLSKAGQKLSVEHFEKLQKGRLARKESKESIIKRINKRVQTIRNWSITRKNKFSSKMLATRAVTISKKQEEKCAQIKNYTSAYVNQTNKFPSCKQVSQFISIPLSTIQYLGRKYGFENLSISYDLTKVHR